MNTLKIKIICCYCLIFICCNKANTKYQKGAYQSTIEESNNDIFYLKDGKLIFNCKFNRLKKIDHKDIRISILKENSSTLVSKAEIKNEFAKLLDWESIENLYLFDSPLNKCSIIILAENENEQFSSYLINFQQNGEFRNKLLLSKLDDEIPGLNTEIYSKISINDFLIEKYEVKSNLIEYSDDTHYVVEIDSIFKKYLITGKEDIILQDSDTISNLKKVINK